MMQVTANKWELRMNIFLTDYLGKFNKVTPLDKETERASLPTTLFWGAGGMMQPNSEFLADIFS